MKSFPPHGALFDWDGVVIDSHDAHEASWHLLAAELGTELPDGFFKATFGMRNDRIIPEFTNWAAADDTATIKALGNRKEALYREILRRDGISPLPGIRELLEELQAAGIPCAVGSSTERANIDLIIEVTGLARFFHAIAASEDVSRGKPAPDVFLCAAARIGVTPELCFVIEDAHAGIAAARAAGCRTIAVATTHPITSFPDADLAVASLTDLPLDRIRSLWPAPPSANTPTPDMAE
jgi:beta-phosphoglucomutase family hydrolase